MFRFSISIEWCPTRFCVFGLRKWSHLTHHRHRLLAHWVHRHCLDWYHSWLHRVHDGRRSSHWLRHHLLRCDKVLRIRLDSISHFRFRLDSFLNIITLTRRLLNFAKIVTKGSLSFLSSFLLSLLS